MLDATTAPNLADGLYWARSGPRAPWHVLRVWTHDFGPDDAETRCAYLDGDYTPRLDRLEIGPRIEPPEDEK